ncbi:MAG TPA: lysophospholipid acyltransferase family protein [bacterium]
MKNLRSYIANLSIVVYTIVVGMIVIIFGLFFPKNSSIFHSISGIWADLILKTSGVSVRLNGAEFINPETPYVVMSNHQSYFDVFSLVAKSPISIYFLAKRALMWIPVLGWAMYFAGHIAIDRGQRERAIRSVDSAAEKIKNGVNILVFPEGTRSHDGNLQSLKKGGFVLAIKAQVPILPVGIYGSRSILPKGAWKITPGSITLTFGKPIDTKNLTLDDRDNLMEIVHKEISSLIEKSKNANVLARK